MQQTIYKPVLEITRGKIVESIHQGAIAVVDSQGKMIAHYGNPRLVTFMRSSAKPLQALAFIEKDGHRKYSFSPAQIALMCASHSGTDNHVAEVRDMLRKIGATEADLLCGAHPPIHVPTMLAMYKRGEEATSIRNNCSGKHTGMIALAKLLGVSPENYIDKTHPVQKMILQKIAEMASFPADSIELGIDGCSVPTFALPIYNAAYAFAKLCDPRGLTQPLASACKTITAAMTSHPDMVGGPDRFDTNFMGASKENAISKMGAEGFMCLGLPPSERAHRPFGIGIAIKIADGDSKVRARPVTALETLRQLGWLSEFETEKLLQYSPLAPITNRRKIKVGVLRPCFELKTEDSGKTDE